MVGFNRAQFEAQVRAAQREAQRTMQAEIDRASRENKRRVDAYKRRVQQHNFATPRRRSAQAGAPAPSSPEAVASSRWRWT